MIVFDSPFFHQFVLAFLIGILFGWVSGAITRVPRWVVGLLSS